MPSQVQQVISPRQLAPNQVQIRPVHPSFGPIPSQERALSPLGLPPVPVFQSKLPEGTPERCASPRPVLVKTVTPRGPGQGPRTVIQHPVMVTPRSVPMEPSSKSGVPTPGRRELRPPPKASVRNASRPPAPAPKSATPVPKRSASKGAKAAPSVVPPTRVHLKGALSQEPRDLTAAGQLPPSSSKDQAAGTPAWAEQDPCFTAFTGILGEPGAVDALCQQLLSRLHAGSSVRWEELVNLSPGTILLELGVGVASSPTSSRKAVKTAQEEDLKDLKCQGWWRALLARHSLYGPGDVIGAAELSELIGAALRYMRDRYAPSAFLRNLRTVHCGSKKLKELYGSFEFYSRGMQGKSYRRAGGCETAPTISFSCQHSCNIIKNAARCRSRLTREEHICRQVCKDKVPAPSDLVRAEVEMLRSLEHPAIPQVIASFEDLKGKSVQIQIQDVSSFMIMKMTGGQCI